MPEFDAATRRDEARARLVEVAATMLREGGASAITTRAVATRAGVQAPTIYRLFGDKDGLIDAVAEDTMATFVAAKTTDAQREGPTTGRIDTDPVADLRAGWQTYIEFGLANPHLFALMSQPDRAARSPATRAGRELLAARVRRVAQIGRLRVAEHHAADLLHGTGTGIVLTLLATAHGDRDPHLASLALDAVLDRILTEPDQNQPGGETGALAAAVTLLANLPHLSTLTIAEQQLLREWLNRSIGVQPAHHTSPPESSREAR